MTKKEKGQKATTTTVFRKHTLQDVHISSPVTSPPSILAGLPASPQLGQEMAFLPQDGGEETGLGLTVDSVRVNGFGL